ncbi:MAG TPA: ABC transporter substrate-binding protein [Bacteroidia bacterium]|jgi:iron complex transport system substrate-binding protein|nr:ABC transporter substrate-binding protein [Bacteroidia bacterium]
MKNKNCSKRSGWKSLTGGSGFPLNALLIAIVISSCGRFGNKEEEKRKDTERIVCVSKQLTELIFALGAGDKVVAVDLSSTYPEAVKKLPTVGYHRMLSAEGIISMKPTVVFYNSGQDASIGPATVLPQLQKVGIPLKEWKGTDNIEDTKALIRDLGAYLHAETKADSLCKKLDADMQLATARLKGYTDKPSVMIIHFGRASNIYFPFGHQGAGNSMIEWAGGVNAIDTSSKFRTLSAEILVKCQPEVILATEFGYDRLGGLDKFKELPGIALTPAAKNNRIYRIEEHDLLYFGPRTGENVLKLIELIHKK